VRIYLNENAFPSGSDRNSELVHEQCAAKFAKKIASSANPRCDGAAKDVAFLIGEQVQAHQWSRRT
jgi:hypothetical protein